MDVALIIIYRALSIILYGFDFLLLVRAVCSWVPDFRNSRVYELSYKVTEPVLEPVRRIMWRFDWARRFPLDLSFLVVCILTTLLERLLGYILVILISL